MRPSNNGDYLILTDNHISILINEIKKADITNYYNIPIIGNINYELTENNILRLVFNNYNLEAIIHLNSFPTKVFGGRSTTDLEKVFKQLQCNVSKFPVFQNYLSKVYIPLNGSCNWSYCLDDTITGVENTETVSGVSLHIDDGNLVSIVSYLLRYGLKEITNRYPLTKEAVYNEGVYHSRKLELDTEITLDLLVDEQIFWKIARAEMYG